MKKLLIALLLLGSCTKPEPIEIITDDLTGRIYNDTTLTADREWMLSGRVSIMPGYTLTIEPGTVIKGRSGTGANASCLIITNGAKINAVGTPQQPIIFTADGDVPPSVRGLWGGLIILGDAIGSFPGGVDRVQIEGIPANDTVGLYGGNNPHHNAGILSYVSIRHGGSDIGEGNEINALTLGCVGDGTIVNNIEIMDNADDGIELFGGSVNVENLLVWGCADDFVDVDQGYAGNINNVLLIPDYVTNNVLELDGGEGSYNPMFSITNCKIEYHENNRMHFRGGANGNVTYTGDVNIVAEPGTNVVIDTLAVINESVFDWTYYKNY